MQQQRSAPRLRAFLPWVVGTLVTYSAVAGEGVTFSDKWSERRPATQRPGAGKRLSFENPFGSFSSGSSSLNGIAAPPFSPPQGTPLSPRERELLQQRRDWIMQTTDDRLGNREEVNRALGVRDYSPDPSKKESEEDKGTLIRYYEKLEAAETAPGLSLRSPPENDTTTRDSLSPLGLDGTPRAPGSDPFRSSLDPSRSSPGSPRLNDIAATGVRGDSLTPATRQFGLWERPFENASSDSRRPSLAFRTSLGADGTAEGPSGIERVLGGAPAVSPVAPLSRGPLTSLDPVTTYPDPTREALNPVVASPATSLGSPLQASGSALGRPMLASPVSPLRNLGAGARGPGEMFGSPAAASSSPRTLNSMKLQLEMPRRGF